MSVTHMIYKHQEYKQPFCKLDMIWYTRVFVNCNWIDTRWQ